MLNSNNVCDRCGGVVKNSCGRRMTIARLTEIHNRSCPGEEPARRKETEDGPTRVQ